MKPTVFTPLAAMCSTMASAIMRSFCAVLNTQRRLSSTGETIFSLAAKAIIGTLASATTSIIARALGETVEPITTSTWFSAMSLRVLLTALVVSDASSSTRYSIFWPAISRGRRSTVFFSGTPSEAAGPVADTVTPTFTCASAREQPSARTRPMTRLFFFICVSPFFRISYASPAVAG